MPACFPLTIGTRHAPGRWGSGYGSYRVSISALSRSRSATGYTFDRPGLPRTDTPRPPVTRPSATQTEKVRMEMPSIAAAPSTSTVPGGGNAPCTCSRRSRSTASAG